MLLVRYFSCIYSNRYSGASIGCVGLSFLSGQKGLKNYTLYLFLTFLFIRGKVTGRKRIRWLYMLSIGQWALVSIFSHFLFIYITWRVLLTVDISSIIKKGKVTEARILLFFIAIVIGSGVSRFFLEIVQWSNDLIFLF